jgi:outer membrane lipoprotein carrier protein
MQPTVFKTLLISAYGVLALLMPAHLTGWLSAASAQARPDLEIQMRLVEPEGEPEGTGATQADVDGEEPADPAEAGETAETAETAEIIAQVQRFYDEVESYHADFEQTYANIALGDTQVSSGHVYFLKPGRMRWDYSPPDEKYLVSDGDVLWAYEPEFNQVVRMDLANNDLPTAIRFLMGEGDLLADFEIEQIECEAVDRICLELVPRVSTGQYRALQFVVDPERYNVVETTIIDPIGNRNHFVFSNANTTDRLPPSGFEFTPPEDARIINTN